MRHFILLLLFLLSVPAYGAERWAVYYTDALPPEAFQAFDMLVFDSDSHPPLAPLKAQHKTLMGYISLGEAEDYRRYYAEIEAKGLLLTTNPRWQGHRIVDVRKPEWTAYAINTLIPATLAQGFDGIMIDTIDSVTQLEIDHPKEYAGMQDAAVNMIKAIRARYPAIKIMINRGFAILPRVVRDIDMVMAESTYARWQPGKAPEWVSAQDRKYYLDVLTGAQWQSPALRIHTLDYWPPEDKEGIARIYAIQRASGFIPYVATPDLQTLHAEPR